MSRAAALCFGLGAATAAGFSLVVNPLAAAALGLAAVLLYAAVYDRAGWPR